MRRLILAGVLAALPAAPAQAGERQSVCLGHAAEANQEVVRVWIHLSPKGERVGSYASWEPPRISPLDAGNFAVPDLSLTIMYDQAGPAGLGPMGASHIWARAFAPPDKRGRSDPERQFAGLSLDLAIDDAPPLVLPLTGNPLLSDLPMLASREAKPPPLPANARTITIRLFRNGKQSVATARYDLTGTAARDRLFATAWQAAESATLSPDTCERTMEQAE